MKKNIPFLIKIGYIFLLMMAFNFLLPSDVRKTLVANNNIKSEVVTYTSVPNSSLILKVLETFKGSLTSYTENDAGCNNTTASGYDISNGNVYYYDSYYGALRIVAADSKFPLGTVVRITASTIFTQPVLAIVLDRGGAIVNTKFDLLCATYSEAVENGFRKDVKYEVLRYGF